MNYLTHKTSNQIYADFINVIKTALNEWQLFDWDVKQLYSPFQTEQLKPTIFITIVSDKDYGSQYSNYRTRITSQKKEITLRFSATRSEKLSDTVNTYNSKDVLTALNDFLRSDIGINTLASLGYAQYKTEILNISQFVDDSEEFKTMPSFQCTYLYTNTFTYKYTKIDEFRGQIYKI